MRIKPVLVPDHDAAELRGLMDRFADATTGPVKKQLNEMDYGGGRSPHAGMGLPRDDDDGDPTGRKEIMVKPETAKKTVKSIGDRLDQAFAQAYNDKGVAENDMSALAGYAAGIVGGAAVPFAAGSLAIAFRDALHRTDDLAKRRARVDTAEIVALQRQIVSINKMIERVKTDETKEKYQTMLKKAYKVLDELKARQGDQVAEGAENNPVVNAITRRIMLQRTDLLSKYGPELVGQAIDEVADFAGDVEEIGSSDVSGWIRHVEQMLGNTESDIAEASPPGGFKSGDRVTVQGQKGPTGSTTGVFVQQIPTTTGQKPMYAFRFDDKKYTGNTYDMVSANNIFPATVAESRDPVEQLRADIQRFAR